jgi:hypothetical protein
MKQHSARLIGQPSSHRILVTSLPTYPRTFTWQIFQERNPIPVDRALRSFKSMEAAYGDGEVSLKRFI